MKFVWPLKRLIYIYKKFDQLFSIYVCVSVCICVRKNRLCVMP